jgi:hypothetical protein
MENEKSDLQKAVDLMEDNGFRVSRAYMENMRDVQNNSPAMEALTGAIVLRITPKANQEK